jgi:tetratricopeptide (TPR) repeat protein
MFTYGEQAGQIVQRFKALPPPEGTPADLWERQKADTVAGIADQSNYVAYVLFSTANQTNDAGQRAALLERFVVAFPDSPYTATAQQLVAAAYQQAQNFPKMLEFANGVLTRDPNNIGMLLLLADHLSTSGEQIEKAEANAKKALELLAAAQKPAGLTDEQWAQQKALQQGLAQSALGQVYIHQKKLLQAVEAFKAANPLLKSDSSTYGRNLYRLGFTYALMKNVAEARKVLTEAVSVDSPYKGPAQETLAKLGAAPAKKRR